MLRPHPSVHVHLPSPAVPVSSVQEWLVTVVCLDNILTTTEKDICLTFLHLNKTDRVLKHTRQRQIGGAHAICSGISAAVDLHLRHSSLLCYPLTVFLSFALDDKFPYVKRVSHALFSHHLGDSEGETQHRGGMKEIAGRMKLQFFSQYLLLKQLAASLQSRWRSAPWLLPPSRQWSTSCSAASQVTVWSFLYSSSWFDSSNT